QRLAGTGPISGRRLAPGHGLGVEIVDVRKRARGEEVVADVADGPLHPTLLAASGHGHGPRVEAIVARERQERRVEPDRLPASLEDGAFKVVVEDHPRDPTERDIVAWRLRRARWRRREINYATRTQMACPRSRIRLSDFTAIATSVTRRASSRDFKI